MSSATTIRRASWPHALAGAALCWAAAAQPAPPPIEAYGRLPGVERMALSPSGSQYAFVAVAGESRKLGVASFDNKLIFQADIGDEKLRDIEWAGEDNLLATFSATVSLPFTLVRLYELDTIAVFRPKDGSYLSVFQKTPSIARAVFGNYGSAMVDGRWQGFFGGLTYGRDATGNYFFSQEYPDLYRVDLETGKAKLQDRGSPSMDGWVLDALGNVVAHADYVENSGRWRLYAGKDRKTLLMERKTPLGEVALVGLGRRPDTVLVLDAAGDEDLLREVPVAGGQETLLFNDDSIDSLLFDPQSRLLVGATVPDDRRAVFFDPRMQARFNGTRKAFPGLEMELVSMTGDLGRLLVKTQGNEDSGTFWQVDIASGKADPVGYEYPQIRPDDVGPTRIFQYKARDGLPIEAVLTLPPGRPAKSLPLVMLPHGGPIGVRDRVGFDWWAQAYASRGYAVLQPNYRGSSGYSRAFLRAGYGEWGGKMLSDIADGLGALAAEGIVDARRACIVGSSYGGYAALAGVTLQQGLYRCAVSVSGVADMPAFLSAGIRRHGYESAVSRFWREATGAATDPAVLRQISPIRHVKSADAPILLIHGQDDTVVPPAQSRSMASALRDADKPVELVMVKGEDHWLSRSTTRVEMLRKSVEFVLRHNPPD